MVIVGEHQSSSCFAIITYNAQESSTILRTVGLAIGALVIAREPVFSGFCLGSDRSNPIFEVRRPIEIVNDIVPNLQVYPIVPNPVTTALSKFHLNGVPLSFIQTLVAAPTCSGVLCDRRIVKTSNCACIQKSSISSWALSCRIFSRDIELLDNDPLSGEVLQSLQLNKLFCSTGTLALPAGDIVLGTLRQAVGRVQEFVNNNGGWVLTGFFKSGLSDENIAQTVSRVQICRIRPTVLIPEDQKYDIAANQINAPLPPLRPPGQA